MLKFFSLFSIMSIYHLNIQNFLYRCKVMRKLERTPLNYHKTLTFSQYLHLGSDVNPPNPIPYLSWYFFLQFTKSKFIQLTLKRNGAFIQRGAQKLLCSPSVPESTWSSAPHGPGRSLGAWRKCLRVSATLPTPSRPESDRCVRAM